MPAKNEAAERFVSDGSDMIVDGKVFKDGKWVEEKSPVCSYCKHYDQIGFRTCKAFPETGSIPNEIWSGKNPHVKPVTGDNGITFAAIITKK